MKRRRSRVATIAAVAGLVLLGGCADQGDQPEPPAGNRGPGNVPDPGFGHVHGLGLNPADGVVYAATHYGVWRLPAPAGTGGAPAAPSRPVRVADRWQDTMGFTVAAPDVFYGSGHPDAREDSPALLGFIVSRDRANTWQPVALSGDVDFHALAAAGDRVYGYDATSGRLLVSADAGRTWAARTPSVLRDVTVDPADPHRVLATSPDGLLVSADAGRSWRPARGAPPLLLVGWADGMLAGAAPDGSIWGAPGGRLEGGWERRGSLRGTPQAFTVTQDGRLLGADHGGVKISADAGRTWTLLAGYDGTSADAHDGSQE